MNFLVSFEAVFYMYNTFSLIYHDHLMEETQALALRQLRNSALALGPSRYKASALPNAGRKQRSSVKSAPAYHPGMAVKQSKMSDNKATHMTLTPKVGQREIGQEGVSRVA